MMTAFCFGAGISGLSSEVSQDSASSLDWYGAQVRADRFCEQYSSKTCFWRSWIAAVPVACVPAVRAELVGLIG